MVEAQPREALAMAQQREAPAVVQPRVGALPREAPAVVHLQVVGQPAQEGTERQTEPKAAVEDRLI